MNRPDNQKQQRLATKPAQKSFWPLAMASVFVGSSIAQVPFANAQSLPPGLIIENQATGSFVNPSTNDTVNIESNIVQLTVAEVAGVTLTPAGIQEAPATVANAGPNQNNGSFEAEDVVYFLFTATNVGNDPTQFYIPGSLSSITNATQAGVIEIIELDTDGPSGATAPQDFSANPITVATNGSNTGDFNVMGLPVGAIPADGTITLRVPVKLDSSVAPNDTVSVVLGDVGSNDNSASTQNQDYISGGSNLDFYTQDNEDTDGISGEGAGDPINGDSSFNRKEASASRTLTIIDPNANDDFGDAPDGGVGINYDTTLASDGARHRIVAGIYLGSGVPDGEVDGVPSANADSDDLNNSSGNDEDGVLISGVSLQGQVLTPGDNITLTINTDSSDTGVLNAWIDWNLDGDFDDDYEQIATNVSPSGGVITLPITVAESGAVASGITYGRFRYSTDKDLTPSGAAIDGEVEDYAFTLEPSNKDYGDAPDTSSGTGYYNYNTLISNDGASHVVTNGLYIGSNPADADSGLLQDSEANTDDINGVPQDEGDISIGSVLLTDSSYSIENISVTNSTSSTAYLVGWLDFDLSGTFDSDEAATVIVPNTGTSTVTLNWSNIPSDIQAGASIVRLRLTTDNTVATGTASTSIATGPANDGEVEDYTATITQKLTGDVCSSPYGEVYSGGDGTGEIYVVHGTSGSTFVLTNSANASTVNSVATDHVNNLVYYADGDNIFAYDPINNQHLTLQDIDGDTRIQDMPGDTASITSLSSGGAAFYGGSLFVGIDLGTGIGTAGELNTIFEIFRIDFESGSNNRVIENVTALGIDDSSGGANGDLLNDGANWGDMIIDDNGILYGSALNHGLFSFNLDTGAYSFITSDYPGQLAKDGQGRIFASSSGQIQQIDVTTGNTIGSSQRTIETADLAECAGGLSGIGDRVWNDIDRDGVQDPNEPGIENVTVALYRDIDGDGTIDTGTSAPNFDDPLLLSTTTDSSGFYSFTNLLQGDYIVQVTDTNNVLSSYSITTGSNLHPVNLPTGISFYTEADFGYAAGTSDPNVLLVKRITSINEQNTNGTVDLNSYDPDTNYPYDDNTLESNVSPEDTTFWPGTTDESSSTFLLGARDGGVTEPGDTIEYTIYFLSAGDADAQNVEFCDRIPDGQTFVGDSYNNDSSTTQDADGIIGEDLGIMVSYNGNDTSYTNIGGDDKARYYPPGSGLPPSCNLILSQTEHNGAVVVNLGNLPKADSSGSPATSYGFVRFRATVD